MQFKMVFLFFSVVSLISCSSTPEPKVLQQSDLQDAQRGFSLSFPDQSEWAVVKKTPYKIVMTKPGLAINDRYTIQVLVVKLPSFQNDKDFMKFVTNRMKKSQKKSNAKIIEQHAQFVEREDKKCVQYNSKRQFSAKAKSVILDIVSFTCRHPDKGNAGVYLAYSKKYSKGNDDKELGANATGVFNHMQLAAF